MMTPDEIQAAIEGLLSVQRNLQEGQLRGQEAVAQQSAQIESLRVTTEGLIRVSENVLRTSTENREFINRLAAIAERQQQDTEQLKRAVDYLLSKDGGE